MPGRIVLYGATGYTGALTAQAMIASGARPVLAGRDQSRLTALAARLGRAGDGIDLETAVASAEKPGSLRDLIGAGDVLVSTAGPFMKVGRPVVAAAVDAGAVYLDSTGEPPFIRQVFEEFGPRAQQTGAVLLTAFGYDYVPGNLAGALALQAAGPGAARVQVGYFVRGDLRRGSSAGTRASMIGMLLEPGYGFRGGRIVTEPTAAHVASFVVEGTKREAYSLGSSELFALPRLRPEGAPDGAPGQVPLTDVSVYLGWFGRATRLVHYGSVLTAPASRLPGVHRALDAAARRVQRSRAAPGNRTAIRSDVVAVAGDASGRELATVHLVGGDPYSFTASILAWAAVKAASDGVLPPGALGPVEAFGAELLESACADAGFHREPATHGSTALPSNRRRGPGPVLAAVRGGNEEDQLADPEDNGPHANRSRVRYARLAAFDAETGACRSMSIAQSTRLERGELRNRHVARRATGPTRAATRWYVSRKTGRCHSGRGRPRAGGAGRKSLWMRRASLSIGACPRI